MRFEDLGRVNLFGQRSSGEVCTTFTGSAATMDADGNDLASRFVDGLSRAAPVQDRTSKVRDRDESDESVALPIPPRDQSWQVRRMKTAFRERLTSTPTVVIVDDDVDLVGRLRRGIADAGYRPVWARDAHEALLAMTDKRPAAIVIDGRLPDTETSALMAKVDRSPALSRIPRVVLRGGEVAEPDSNASPTCFKSGNLERLLSVIRRMIGRANTPSA